MENVTPIRVLHVEDNPSDRKLVQIYLGKSKEAAFELVQVDRLSLAREVLRQEKFDVILLDLNLPDGWGKTLYDEVRALAPATPLLVLSGSQETGEEGNRSSVAENGPLLLEDATREELIRVLLDAVKSG